MSAGSLHIAMVVPPWFELPPTAYGGIESMCADLVDALVARGHQVTLVGAGGHRTKATAFVRTYDEPQGARIGAPEPEVVHAAGVAYYLEESAADIVHDHSLAGPLLARGRRAPTVVTVHGPVVGERGQYYRYLGKSVHLVGISDAQRQAAPDLNWVATVHNAVRVADFPLRRDKEDFLLFLGRMAPEKGAHLAVEAARAAGRRLLLAGKCTEPTERAYFAEAVQPRLGPDTEYIGEIDAERKKELLAAARCLLFPICWEEPFGMVMIEAMACGTPVVALRRGAVPEVVVDRVTGRICDRLEELPRAVAEAEQLDPEACRAHVANRFDVAAMAAGYEAVYQRVLAQVPVLEPAPAA